MKTFTFHGWNCAVSKGLYTGSERVRLDVYDADNQEPVCVATVNLPDYIHPGLDDGTYVLIKDWSENEGILDALIEAGYIHDAQSFVPTGYVMADLCRLRPEAFA